MPTSPLVLVTGPASSGKSEWAESLADQSRRRVIYIATAQRMATDPEWEAKIKAHQQRRPPHWQLWEIPQDLAPGLADAPADSCVLIDSLGTWVANQLTISDPAWEKLVQELLATLKELPAIKILVAEETGWGVIPAYPLGRLFRQRLGTLTRKIGIIADEVYLVTGGYVLPLHHLGMPLDSTQLMI
ncbi:bifunctional adenosylcobinamide kinase/adenosylcobinamide-phosphate guanylyltransferase [Synechococcus sp. PCC 6312]|uniref:bifunctional adenosylcobinamide kinase/adenosylcobinamide-phosphate guanylyltransferase n=1 Tax=Synechococcus sp. (strain ATCC 27167 / PCC 6312) TaxID=195253 RepID=UPI00029EEAA7|nr:bifunctional adenosylcobinamide kinase/adenosylcobinamide-phosphate guanylyltransferase [Synechococcus sp. PCC 6312]AFY59691.1 adenosyl cobinamide kinase/adenosyl cobinamide phosphate guanylyltransferase [Synechococcus sp. PCC 6312]